jgi:hypothetical protein
MQSSQTLVLAMTLLVAEQHPIVGTYSLLEIGIVWRRRSWIAGRFTLFREEHWGRGALVAFDPV